MPELDQPLVRPGTALHGIEDATSFALGQGFACAVTRGVVRCFGDNRFGELGAKLAAERSETPVEVSDLRHAKRVFAGPWHACATLDDGTVRCWGRNESGQTGSETDYRPEARELAGSAEVPGVKAVEVACSFGTTCARSPTREVWCWGNRQDYRSANYNAAPTQRPTLVAGLTDVDEIASGESSFCAVRRGEIACWGEGLRFVPGATEHSDAVAVIPGISNAKHVAIADDHGCALLADGRVACFGFAYSRALGRDADENGYEPLPGEVVSGLSHVVAITASNGMSCALTRDSEVFCWGRWYSAQGAKDEPKPFPLRLR
jgi:alpha-tubulin suppressor-like RCC1 family protein